MPSSTVIRLQRSSLVNQNQYANKDDNKKHTISMFRLFLHLLDYIYLFNINVFLYILLLVKRTLRFFSGFFAFIFVTLRGSKRKVRI